MIRRMSLSKLGLSYGNVQNPNYWSVFCCFTSLTLLQSQLDGNAITAAKIKSTLAKWRSMRLSKYSSAYSPLIIYIDSLPGIYPFTCFHLSNFISISTTKSAPLSFPDLLSVLADKCRVNLFAWRKAGICKLW